MEKLPARGVRRACLLALVGAASFAASADAQVSTDATPLKVVQIGDSYSAGNGADNYYGPRDCYRSSENWGEKYVDMLRPTRSVTFVNRACSGGVLDDLTKRREHDETVVSTFVRGEVDKDDPAARQALDDGGRCSTRYRDDEVYEVEALFASPGPGGTTVTFRCTRFMEPQIDAIGKDTDLVVFTIGGNDVEFAEIVKQCFALGFRDPGSCKDRVEAAQGGIGEVGKRTEVLLRTLKGKMRPDAKIVLVAYPYLEKNEDFELRGGFLFLTNYAVGREVRKLGDLGDEGQQAAADAVNAEPGADVTFLDTVKPHFAGHEPDGRARLDNDDRWVNEFGSFTMLEWYHFNPRGHTEIANLLGANGDFGADGVTQFDGASVDISFVIDTTGSMGSAINSVKEAATSLVDAVNARAASARFSLVDYRDFPERTGFAGDYPAKLQQDFTSDPATINAAIQGLALGSGGDTPETMFSGIDRAFDLSWRPGVKKLVVVLADAPPLSPEPVTGLTADDIVARSLAIDPVEAQVVDIGSAGSAAVQDIVARTNGALYRSAPSAAADQIATAIDTSLDKPYAWAGGPYVGRIGKAHALDGSGSYGVTAPIVRWEWDVDGDGTYDIDTNTASATHTYEEPFDGLVGLRVTDAGGRSGLATVVGHASVDGDEVPGPEDNCPTEANAGQEDEDEDGTGNACDRTIGFPTEDKPGVSDGLARAGGSGGPSGGGSAGGGATPGTTPRPATRADIRIERVVLASDGGRAVFRLTCKRTAGTCRGRVQAVVGSHRVTVRYRARAKRGTTLVLRLPSAERRRSGNRRRIGVRLKVTTDAGATATRAVKVQRLRG